MNLYLPLSAAWITASFVLLWMWALKRPTLLAALAAFKKMYYLHGVLIWGSFWVVIVEGLFWLGIKPSIDPIWTNHPHPDRACMEGSVLLLGFFLVPLLALGHAAIHAPYVPPIDPIIRCRKSEMTPYLDRSARYRVAAPIVVRFVKAQQEWDRLCNLSMDQKVEFGQADVEQQAAYKELCALAREIEKDEQKSVDAASQV